ncbi:MAG: hypothetical protein HYS62_01955, partial [Candidatus Aenigmarchaeota archaeon]|nr:hypothetical protein [Candidatus Aenigmarchaeota archaeon]
MKEILPGDGIRTKRKIYWHYGLFAGDVDGKKMVFENTLKGVRLVTLEDFANGKELEVIPYEGAT